MRVRVARVNWGYRFLMQLGHVWGISTIIVLSAAGPTFTAGLELGIRDVTKYVASCRTY